MSILQALLFSQIKAFIKRTNLPAKLGLDPEVALYETFVTVSEKIQNGSIKDLNASNATAYFSKVFQNVMLDIARKNKHRP